MSMVNLRIAIADDDRANRELLHELLQRLGHVVVASVENGRRLIEVCASLRPDVVITDNLMPEVSGAEAATIIYTQHPTQIILLSAFCDRDLIIAAEQKPILMYLVKPVAEKHLQVVLNRCVELRQQQERNDQVAERETQSFSGNCSGGTTQARPAAIPPYEQGRMVRR